MIKSFLNFVFLLASRSFSVGLGFIFFSFLIFQTLAQETGSDITPNPDLNSNLNIDFSWQVLNSYVPAFYEGRPLPGEQSLVKVVANIQDSRNFSPTPNPSQREGLNPNLTDANNLFYEWVLNDIYVFKNSAIGKNILTFELNQLKNKNQIELKIYDLDEKKEKRNLLTEKNLTIEPYDTLAILYKENENSLVKYSNAINKKYQSYGLNKKESLNILAEPFYFSTENPNDKNLGYEWRQNGISGLQKNSNTFTLEAPEYQYGDLSLELKINNANQFLQSAKTLFSIELTNPPQ